MPDALVLLTEARHPVSGRPMRSPFAARALELALRLDGVVVSALFIGDPQSAAIVDYLGMGLPDLTILSAAPMTDASTAIVDQVRRGKADIILCGAPDGMSDMLPYRIAAALDRPLIADVVEAASDANGWTLLRALPRAWRQEVRCATPFVVTVGAGGPVARLPAAAAARRGRIEMLRDVVQTEPAASAALRPVRKLGRPLARPVDPAGGSRLAAFMPGGGTAAGNRGGAVSPDEAAAEIMGWLAARNLLPETRKEDSHG